MDMASYNSPKRLRVDQETDSPSPGKSVQEGRDAG